MDKRKDFFDQSHYEDEIPKKECLPYNEKGQQLPLDWSFFQRPKLKKRSSSCPPYCYSCPHCQKVWHLTCPHCKHGVLEPNYLNSQELVCSLCEKSSTGFSCSCGFKVSSSYLQKKVRAIKRKLRDGDRREYFAIFLTIVLYLFLVWSIVGIGNFIHYP